MRYANAPHQHGTRGEPSGGERSDLESEFDEMAADPESLTRRRMMPHQNNAA